jgi:hypothetical protein
MTKNYQLGIPSRFIFAVSIALALMAGCSISPPPRNSGDLLMVDDFGSRRLNWKTWQQPGSTSASYLDGGFVLVVESPNMDAISTNGVNFENLDIKVIAGKIAGSDDNQYGLVCRFLDNSNYYGFLVTSDGYYGVLRVKDGAYQMLSSGNFEYSDEINHGVEDNIINAVCLQNLLVLNVNGRQVAMVTDDTFSSGQAGLIAGTFADPHLVVKFDNFTITAP